MNAITKVSDLPPPYEDEIHASIIQRLLLVLPLNAVLHHSPNEGKRGWKSQHWLKRSGTRRGWPDIEIGYFAKFHFMEVKRPGETPTKIQRECHYALRDAGFTVDVVHNQDEALASWHRFAGEAWKP